MHYAQPASRQRRTHPACSARPARRASSSQRRRRRPPFGPADPRNGRYLKRPPARPCAHQCAPLLRRGCWRPCALRQAELPARRPWLASPPGGPRVARGRATWLRRSGRTAFSGCPRFASFPFRVPDSLRQIRPDHYWLSFLSVDQACVPKLLKPIRICELVATHTKDEIIEEIID